jgi:dihydroneopterin aldolase / 2-amino-4-hydroxy-6-hydroxymethyldihydropteridine diphosphokinase / dihydropteroate synthase
VVRTALETLGEYSDIVTARVSKPSAILFADAAQVEVTRQLADFKKTEMATLLPTSTRTNFQSLFEATKLTHARPENAVSAVIAFGSNLGDRFANIELALRLLEARDTLASEPRPYLTIIDTSFLYETAPMYVTDQPEFINGVCVVRPNLVIEIIV